MKVAVTVQHPAHVHFFKYTIRQLRSDGHEVQIYAREKDVAVDLLESYGLPHEVLASGDPSGIHRIVGQLRYEGRLLARVRRWRPDVITAIGGLGAAHVSSVTGSASLVFTDTELRTNQLMAPFADVICTPRGFVGDFGAKHRRYDGFHELAYLHPNRFTPDPDVLAENGVDPFEPFVVARFSDMQAQHDAGQAGFSPRGKRELVASLGRHGTVFVAAEGAASDAMGQPIPVPVHQFHHLLAFADLVVTDSSTTATEAALLGTPTVRSNSFAGEGDLSNFVELGDRYGLVSSTPEETVAIDRCRAILEDPTAGERWRSRRDALLSEKIDVVPYVVEQLHRLADTPPRDGVQVVTRAG